MPNCTNVAWLVCFGIISALGACKSTTPSQPLEWSGSVNGGGASDSSKQPVLIYYTNETGRNFGDAVDMNDWKSQRIIEILKNGVDQTTKPTEKKYLQTLSEKFEKDRAAFSSAAFDEAQVFDSYEQPCRLANHLKTPTAMFSNREALMTLSIPGVDNRPNWYYCAASGTAPGKFEPHEVKWDATQYRPESMYHPLYSNPLADPRVLELALTEVAKVFSPKTSEYVLVTKSHGTTSLALGVFINIDVGELDPQKFIKDLLAYAHEQGQIPVHSPLGSDKPDGSPLGSDKPDGSPLGSDKPDGSPLGSDKPDGSPLGSDKPDGSPLGGDATAYLTALNISAAKAVGLAGEDLPAAFGTTKVHFLEILAAAGARGMRFPLVVMESCNGRAGLEAAFAQLSAENSQIGTVFSSDPKGLDYKGNIDWVALASGAETDIRLALRAQLKARAEQAANALK